MSEKINPPVKCVGYNKLMGKMYFVVRGIMKESSKKYDFYKMSYYFLLDDV